MSCCGPAAEFCLEQVGHSDEEIILASRTVQYGLRQTDLSVPEISCGACLQTIEAALGRLMGVRGARANLSTRRVTVFWSGDAVPPMLSTLKALGYEAHLHDFGADDKDPALSQLLRALAVAGFASSNIMLLSVSVWSGAEPETRDLFHWISALIALPTLAYSGRVFFVSAWRSLGHGRTNMDVPISIGVLLTFGLSLYETIQHGPYAYFDAAVSLLFVLLIGRTLDHVMRERARQAVSGLARLAPRSALVLQPDGARAFVPVSEIEPGMTILLAAGERVPVNARVTNGASALDCSLVSGESTPQPITEGTEVLAGVLNLTGPLELVATTAARDSFLAEMVRMMEAAEAGRSSYRGIADRAARLYAPIVHTTALLTFAGWMIATGDAHRAFTVAIAVLIITCPCALGLAVPMVHVMAARRLFENGIMVRNGSALERLAGIDTVIFDKTGTLTTGRPRLVAAEDADEAALALAASIAACSQHPYSRALALLGDGHQRIAFDAVAEHPGLGLEAWAGSVVYRLGRPDWAVTGLSSDGAEAETVVLSANAERMTGFRIEDRLRSGAQEAFGKSTKWGLRVAILSGDNASRVREIAAGLGVTYLAGARPADKLQYVSELRASGRNVLMVGDGLNDAPALMAADVSMAPASAADIGRNAADLVFLRESLEAIPQTIAISRRANVLVRQNFGLAVAYNLVAIPVAVLGHVTPLLAAVAMSLSSLTVIANALRLDYSPRTDRHGAGDSRQADAAPLALGSRR
jgi:Cu2+-exporting ATPase